MKSGLLLILAAGAASAQTDPYVIQVSGGVERLDAGINTDVDSRQLSASYYFRPVDTASGPLAKAAFLSRSSHASLTLYDEDQATASTVSYGPGGVFYGTSVRNSLGYGLSGRHVWRDSGWYIGAHGGRTKGDAVSLNVTKSEADAYGLALGKYVLDATAVDLRWDSKTSRSTSVLACPAFLTCAPDVTVEIEVEELAVGVQHVGGFGRFGYALSAEVASSETKIGLNVAAPTSNSTGITPNPPPFGVVPAGGVVVAAFAPATNPDRVGRYSASGELFPTRRLGLRLGYSRWDGDLASDDRYELGASWFFLPKVAFRAMLARTRGTVPGTSLDDIDTAGISFVGRL